MKARPTLLAAAVAAAFAAPSVAADRYWVCGSNAWNTNCWADTFAGIASGLQPLDGDTVWLTQNDAVHRVVSYINTQFPDTLLGNVVIDATGTGSMTLEQARDAMRTQYLYVGTSGTGTYTQTGGTASASVKVSLGYAAGGSGTYNLREGTLSSADQYIGDNGTGRLVQTAGGNTVSGTLNIGYGAGSNGFYEFNDGVLNSGATVVGRQGWGNFEQRSGLHTVGTLNLGLDSGSMGSYRLSGGTLEVGNVVSGAGTSTFEIMGGNLKLTGNLFSADLLVLDHGVSDSFSLKSGQTLATKNVTYVGYNHSGSITNAGAIHRTRDLWIQGNGSSSYSLTGDGQLSVAGTLNISGAGGEYRQTGGSATIGTLFLGPYGNYTTDTSRQVVTLTGGSLTTERLWNGRGTSTFNIDGGTLTVLDTAFEVDVFHVGSTAGSQGSVTAAAGQVMTTTTTVVGKAGMGRIDQFNGEHRSTTLVVGELPSSNGLYGLWGDGGVHSTTQTVGLAGLGYFAQTDGTNTVSQALTIGVLPGALGTYELSGGTLDTQRLTLGVSGSAAVRQGGGAVRVGDRLEISTGVDTATAGGSGTYELYGEGATLDTAFTVVGAGHRGDFVQSAGRHTATSAVWLGETLQGDGRYGLNGGTLSAPTLVVGLGGKGQLSIRSNGGAVLSDSLVVGHSAGSIGEVLMEDGASLTAPLQVIGRNGSGLFQQNGGINTTGTLNIAADNVPAIYSMAGGSFTATDAYIGAGRASGTFAQSAGIAGFTNSLVLGNLAGASGTYILNGTGTVQSKVATVGSTGVGSFTQTGGTHTVSNVLGLGTDTTGAGTYTLQGNGVLDSPFTHIGVSGSGSFVQMGGNHRSTWLTLGFMQGSAGEYALSGGALQTQGVAVGAHGSGRFMQSGGIHTASTLTLGGEPTGTGSYELSGGVLNVGQLHRGPGTSSFNWTAGTLQLTASDLEVDDGSFFGRQLSLGPGMQFIASNQHVAAVGNVLQTGGSNTALQDLRIDGSYRLAGGSLSVHGALDNSGMFELAGGTLEGDGALVNNSLLSGRGRIAGSGGFTNMANVVQSGGSLTLANSGHTTNLGNWDLAVGTQLRLDEADLDNAGALNLNGGNVVGIGRLTNGVGGTLTGRGSITTAFSNAGGVVVVDTGNLRIQNGFANEGAVVLGGPGASLTGGRLDNYGTVQGRGSVGNELSNQGTVEALGGTLVLSGHVVNQSGGVLRAAQGSKLLMSMPNGGNAGLVNLIGGTLDTGSQVLDNAGQITGHGLVATGGLNNLGTVTLVGGGSTVSGEVFNAANGFIEVAHSNAVFTARVENHGLFKTTDATVTFAGGYSEAGVYLSDPSDNHFTELEVGPTGALQAGVGDRFFISGDFINHSQQALRWNTTDARLVLNGHTQQQLALAAPDLGANGSAWQNNYAWGEFSLGLGSSVSFLDGNNTPGAAFYVGSFELAGGVAQIAQITSPYNIYYDPDAAANAYLGGRNYALAGGGQLLAAVPEPQTWCLWLAGLAAMGWRARRVR